MKIERIIRSLDATIHHILDALDGGLDADNNFAPQGIEGHVLTSRGTGARPTWGDKNILVSPDGTRYRLVVANDGTLSTVPA